VRRGGFLAAAVVGILVAGCASGSDGDVADVTGTPSTPPVAEGTGVAELAEVAGPDAAPATDPPLVTAPADSGSAPSLPANIWPEDVVDTTDLGEDGDAKDVVTRSVDAVGDGVQPSGVETVAARVTSPDGEICEICLWLADDDPTRQRGLMDVTDLGDAVGMAFRYEQPTTGNFFMFQTPTPLSIAWFDDAGAHVGQADMEPCLVENSATCERYTADAPYVLAVEMFGGQLEAIGIGPGSSIELLDLPCT